MKSLTKREVVEITLSKYQDILFPIVDIIDAEIINAAKDGKTSVSVEISHNDLSFENMTYLRLYYTNLGFDVDTLSSFSKESCTTFLLDWGH